MSEFSPEDQWRMEQALERFQIIASIVNEDLELSDRRQRMRKIAEDNGISLRTVERYYRDYLDNGIDGLMPEVRGRKLSATSSERFRIQLQQAIVLLRENPTRPVRMLIKTMVLEGYAEDQEIKRSTLQKHLFEEGYGKTHLRAVSTSSSRSGQRWCKPHRMQLVQTDFKYSIVLPLEEGGGKPITVYLCTQLDDHSKKVLHTRWYLNQCVESVEDSVKTAILTYGTFDQWYTDRGSSFNATDLVKRLARLGIKKATGRPYHPQGRGKVESYHRHASMFLTEVPLALDRIKTLDDLNRFWLAYLDQYYSNEPHEGIAEYYRQNNKEYPKEGISPNQEFDRDTRELKFLDAALVNEVFLHHEQRKVNNGVISFDGLLYDASPFTNGTFVEVYYDPFHKEKVSLRQANHKDYVSTPIPIGDNIDFEKASRLNPLPAVNTATPTGKTSRVLNAFEKAYEEKFESMPGAISFFDMLKESDD